MNIDKDSTFHWFTNILRKGYSESIKLNDLPPLPNSVRSENSMNWFNTNNTASRFTPAAQSLSNINHAKSKFIIDKEESSFSSSESLNIIRIVVNAHGLAIMKLGIIRLVGLLLTFVSPMLLGEIVRFIENRITVQSLAYGSLLVCTLAISSIASSMLNTNSNLRSWKIKTKIQGALTRILFRRALSLSTILLNKLELNEARIMNLIQVDIENISNSFNSINDLWYLPLQIVIVFIILYACVKIAFISGLVVVVILIPINGMIAKHIGIETFEYLHFKDLRMSIITMAIKNACSMKMTGLDDFLLKLSNLHRENEIKHLGLRKYLDACCVFLWAITPIIVPFVTFMTSVALNQSLTSADVLTAIALLNMLIFPLNMIPMVVNEIMGARVSLERVARILFVNEQSNIPMKSDRTPQLHDINNQTDIIKNPMGMENIYCFWEYNLFRHHVGGSNAIGSFQPNGNRKDELLRQIGPIHLDFAHNKVICICGPPASGKSTLLLGLLNEIYSIYSWSSDQSQSPSLNRRIEWIYSPQSPSLLSGCIRSNILLGSKYHPGIYAEVIEGCQLQTDLKEILRRGSKNDAHVLEGGDLVDIGQGGCHLSGGQRLRIGLARALYHALLLKIDTKSVDVIMLLDDPFSAIDYTTSHKIKDFLQNLTSKYALYIIVTTHSQSIIESSQVFNSKWNIKCLRYGEEYNSVNQYDTKVAMTHTTAQERIENSLEESILDSNSINIEVNDVNYIEDEDKNDSGTIHQSVYYAYFGSVGWILSCTIFLVAFVLQGISMLSSLWFTYWAKHQNDFSHHTFYLYSTYIVTLSILLAIFRSFLFAYGGMKAATKLYFTAVSGVFHASIQFFESTTSGNILNRLGKDTIQIDDQLPFFINISLSQIFILFNSLLLIMVNDQFMIPIIILLGWCYYRLQHFYRATSRELRRMDSKYRTPVYTIISESLQNGPVIRSLSGPMTNKLDPNFNYVLNSYHDEVLDDMETLAASTHITYDHHCGNCAQHFDNEIRRALDRSLRVDFSVMIASQWLSFRLQLIGTLITSSLVISIILNQFLGGISIDSSLAGLSLLYSFTIVSSLSSLISVLSETEQEMVSVERVLKFSNLPSEYHNADREGADAKPISEKAEVWKSLRDLCLILPKPTAPFSWNIFGTKRKQKLSNRKLVHQSSIHSLWFGYQKVTELDSDDDIEIGSTSSSSKYYGNHFPRRLRFQSDGFKKRQPVTNSTIPPTGTKSTRRWKKEYINLPQGSSHDEVSEFSNEHESKLNNWIPLISIVGNFLQASRSMTNQTLSHSKLFSVRSEASNHNQLEVPLLLQNEEHPTETNVKFNEIDRSMIDSLKPDQDTVTPSTIDDDPNTYKLNNFQNAGIVFQNVWFSYHDIKSQNDLVMNNEIYSSIGPPLTSYVLKNFNLVIPTGSRVAIIGRTGSGKSTLLRILLRLSEYQHKESSVISIAGDPLDNIAKKYLRHHMVGVIPQSPILIPGTIRLNLDPYNQYDDEEVLHALKMCRFYESTLLAKHNPSDEAIEGQRSSSSTNSKELKKLLKSNLVDGGNDLSQGQKQLLSLGRAILKRSSFIFIDEATSSVDFATEKLLYETLRDHIQRQSENVTNDPPVTLLMICHKLDHVSNLCNKVLELNDGEIVDYEDLETFQSKKEHR